MSIHKITIIFPFSELLLMTVATEKTDAFLRYIRSAEVNKLKGKVCNENVYLNQLPLAFTVISVLTHNQYFG